MEKLEIIGQRLNGILGKKIEVAAKYHSNVLIVGETGVGKGLVAETIHKKSGRSGELEVVHCPALPQGLLESGLFGHVKGSFTGGVKREDGILLNSKGGTVFLDEISEIPTDLQVKILRAVEEKKIRPVGAKNEIPIDVRIIAASNQNLQDLMASGKFRKDLFYRLNDISINIPPLRERREDIPALVSHFVELFTVFYKKRFERDLAQFLPLLQAAPWDGNVRELRTVIKGETIMPFSSGIDELVNCNGSNGLENTGVDMSENRQIPESFYTKGDGKSFLTFTEARMCFEHDYLCFLLKKFKGNVRQASYVAGKEKSYFYDLLKRNVIDLNSFKKF